jgi:tetratricopeptide (TPR) repeat protein
MRYVLPLCVALATSVCVTQPARGDDVAKAKRLFKKAEAHFAKGRFQQALELYLRAYEAKPLPGFHFNIGQCYRGLNQHEQAVEHFEKYLASPNPKHRADAERLVQLSRDALEQQRKDQPPEEPPVPEEQPPGLAPTPPIAAPVAPEPKPEPPPPPKRGRRRLKPIYFWTGVGVTAALLLTGTITGGMALSKSSEFNDESTPYGDLQDLKDSGESLRTAANVTFGLSLATAVGTAVLYFFTDFSGKETAVSAAPTSGGGMVTVGGSF